MPHYYLVETTHGEREFTTDVHHDTHHRGIVGWVEDHSAFLTTLIQALAVGAQILAIYHRRGGPGGPLERVR